MSFNLTERQVKGHTWNYWVWREEPGSEASTGHISANAPGLISCAGVTGRGLITSHVHEILVSGLIVVS